MLPFEYSSAISAGSTGRVRPDFCPHPQGERDQKSHIYFVHCIAGTHACFLLYLIYMNLKLIVGGLIAVVVVGAIGLGIFRGSEPEAPAGTFVDEDFVNTRPDVQARPNTFSVMTPEEKAAAEEAARIAAEEALSASSTATSTASTTDDIDDDATDEGEGEGEGESIE